MSGKGPIQHLVASLSRLPGIGEKTATRLALYIVNCERQQALELARSIVDVREKVRLCRECLNYAEQDYCSICANPGRNADVVCVVETPADLLSIERAGSYTGKYHVLHGVVAPLDGMGPDDIRIRELVERVGGGGIREVIIATNPTMNGNATAGYIADQLKATGVAVTRIAQGMPSGGDIGYADRLTLKNAFEGRRKME
ncbi:MAG: recombination protein RecR [Deltaproteobacteria bacterium]|nr:recombination protein RecR [Deltaproteobacteria bacterium]